MNYLDILLIPIILVLFGGLLVGSLYSFDWIYSEYFGFKAKAEKICDKNSWELEHTMMSGYYCRDGNIRMAHIDFIQFEPVVTFYSEGVV